MTDQPRLMERMIVAGIGMSSRATREEIGALLDDVLRGLGLSRRDISALATRERFRVDARLLLGAPVVGVTDDQLVASSTPAATRRTVGIEARVAETAALLAVGGGAVLLAPTTRSAHATVAVAAGPGPIGGCVPPAGEHGGDGHRVASALGLDPATVLDLSASMNPFAPDAGAAIRNELDRAGSAAVTSYPDPMASTRILADAIGVDAQRLVLTNGGAEAIALVAAHERVGHVVDPEFSLYARHLERIDPTAPRWRSNPSNPLGELAGAGDRAGVWDEAFYPLATGEWTRGDDAAWRLGSLTKLWSCPGLRLGYVVAPDAHAARAIRDRQPAWAVNGLALAVLPRLLEVTDLPDWQRGVSELRAELVTALRSLGFAVTETSVNWVLVEREGLRSDLAERGVVVRDCASFGLAGVHRVAVPAPDAFDRALAAFAAVA